MKSDTVDHVTEVMAYGGEGPQGDDMGQGRAEFPTRPPLEGHVACIILGLQPSEALLEQDGD